ncbi:MoxR-like ATPase, partial [Vibrio nigripulchritudo ATCC 27043]|uniref:zinc-dependent metalloprotease n=1 Tax=Vibrio nigripulchritudo TaxID=28173 RepID=UPI00021C1F67
MNFKKLSLVTAVGAALVGCGADDQAYDTVSKPEQQFAKSNIKTDQVYLFMPSLAKAPKYAVSMMPFYPGQEKLVTLSFEGSFDNDTSGGLKARLLNPDLISQNEIDSNELGRWLDEQSNAQPILTIPGDFVDYQCKEDSYGDCTNKEEKVDNNEVPWNLRNYFLPKFADVKVHQFNFLAPTRLDNCYSTSGKARLATNPESGWKGYEVTADGVINFEVEQDFKVKDGFCFLREYVQQDLDLDNLSFTVSQFYSLVPLDLVRSKSDDYEPVVYQRYDSDRFGYFFNKVGRPDVSYSRNEWDNEFEYLHRFNPNKEVINYHLTDSFNVNEESKFFKRVTQETIERMNSQITKVGVPQIKLHEPSGKQAGDLRYNVIHLIDEPLDNGLAGLGPTAVNPLTGEIISGHVNQYSGVIRAGSSWRWDSIATDFNKGRVDTAPKDEKVQSASNSGSIPLSSSTVVDYYADDANVINAARTPEIQEYESIEQVAEIVTQEMARISHEGNTFEQTESIHALEKRLWAENNMYPVESLAHGIIHVSNLPKAIGGITFDYLAPEWWNGGSQNAGKAGYLKVWTELTAEQQERLSLFIAGVSYAQVLVHELGHNLGLRHNFKGSNDISNFFAKDNLAEHKLRTVPGYTSIMDYNGSFYDEPVFGPYDLAALRFGYKRQVEVQATQPELDSLSKKYNVESNFVSVETLDKKLLEETLDPLGGRSDVSEFGVIRVLGREPELKLPHDESKIRVYKYCTDGHVSLNDDCNRFDAGANRAEIMKDRFRKYDERYYRTTIRGMRDSFSEYSQTNYLFRRLNLFMDWRNSTHNFERSMGDTNKDHQIFIRSFVNADFPNTHPWHWAVGPYYGTPATVDMVRDKLLEIMSTPDHYCEVKNADGSFAHKKLADIIGDFRKAGNFGINEVPTSCFDASVTKTLESFNQVAVAETGKYLNSGSAPRSAAENNYSNLIDYMG